ncbi:uncharacterized protein LOC144687078 [Cetorhinus maximus]
MVANNNNKNNGKEAVPSKPLPPRDPSSRKSSVLRKKRAQWISKPTAPPPIVTWMEIGSEFDSEEEAKEMKFDDSPMDGELYFKDSQEILDIFFLLEEQIFFILQYCQEAEEDIQRVNQKWTEAQETMKKHLNSWIWASINCISST